MNKLLLFLLPFTLSAQFDPNVSGTTGLWQTDAVSKVTLDGVNVDVALDQIASQNLTTPANQPAWGPNYMAFDGSNSEYIFTGDYYDPRANDFSFDIFFKTGADVTTLQYLILKGTSGNYWRVVITTGLLGLRIFAGANWVLISPAIVANTNYLFSFSGDRDGTQRAYLNGVSVLDQSTTNTVDINNAANFTIATQDNISNFFTGFVYEARIVAGVTTDHAAYYADLQCRYLSLGCSADKGLKKFNRFPVYKK